jgi:hypothetical protein
MRILNNRTMKIDQISDGFCAKMSDAGVENAARANAFIKQLLYS